MAYIRWRSNQHLGLGIFIVYLNDIVEHLVHAEYIYHPQSF